MTFGEKLQKLRKSKGWTQEELAAQISISRQALSKWEQGTVIPDTENILQISRLFGVSTDYLLHDDYESDADIPAVHTSSETLTRNFKSRTQSMIGAGISLLGLIGFVVLYIVAAYSPVHLPASEGTDHIVSGFGPFISAHRFEWLVGLLLLFILTGVSVMSASFLRNVWKAKNEGKHK